MSGRVADNESLGAKYRSRLVDVFGIEQRLAYERNCFERKQWERGGNGDIGRSTGRFFDKEIMESKL